MLPHLQEYWWRAEWDEPHYLGRTWVEFRLDTNDADIARTVAMGMVCPFTLPDENSDGELEPVETGYAQVPPARLTCSPLKTVPTPFAHLLRAEH